MVCWKIHPKCLPSGKHSPRTMGNHHVKWVNQLFLWQFSIAMLDYQRVNAVYSWENHGLCDNVDAPFEVGGLRLTNPPVFRGGQRPNSLGATPVTRAGDDNESVGPLAASDIHHSICGRFSLVAPAGIKDIKGPTRWCPSSLAKLVYNSHNYGLWQI